MMHVRGFLVDIAKISSVNCGLYPFRYEKAGNVCPDNLPRQKNYAGSQGLSLRYPQNLVARSGLW